MYAPAKSGNAAYSSSAAGVRETLHQLFILETLIQDKASFEQELLKDQASFTFFPPEVENDVVELIKANRLKTNPIVFSDRVENAAGYSIPVIANPVWAVPLANALNGAIAVQKRKTTAAHWTAPDAKILVVDDMVTNLKMVKGLLTPYGCEIDLCVKGGQAVDLVEEQYYDIVFMDHLMPDMDGIETAEKIRALAVDYAKRLRIIMLTANAAAGMREMFLERGMNDFLAKPIEIAKLDAIMEKWIPEEKKVREHT
jgi:CheY-like chemotaxis protein